MNATITSIVYPQCRSRDKMLDDEMVTVARNQDRLSTARIGFLCGSSLLQQSEFAFFYAGSIKPSDSGADQLHKMALCLPRTHVSFSLQA